MSLNYYIIPFLALLISLLFRKIRNNWIFHILVCMLFYGFYGLIYYYATIPKLENHHYGDRLMGFVIMIFFTSPIYLLYHLIFILYSKRRNLNKIYLINIIFLVLCLIILSAVIYQVF